MYAIFEESGKFLSGRILSEGESSLQIELDTGKRVKVKAAHLLLKFDKPSPNDLIAQAREFHAQMDANLAWEFAPDDEFGFADLASEYFEVHPNPAQQVAALLLLFESPHYFRRAGKGRFKKAPSDIVRLALAAIEKKRQVALQIEEWAQTLSQGNCPAPIREQLFKILFKPDKNAPEYKAVVEASRVTQTAPLAMLQRAGVIDSAYHFHWNRFLFDNFPKGTGFPALPPPDIAEQLPLAPVKAFSVDDSQTTEIDDALSLQGMGSGTVVLGIHIAAPGLAITPGSPLDQVARARLSTVYMPGNKITMLPDEVVQSYTLAQGHDCPVVSLYVSMDEATLDIHSTQTKLERISISANLRHDRLDNLVTESWLSATVAEPSTETTFAELGLPNAHQSLAFLHRLAQHLKSKRELVRGKPENFNRPDYNFRLEGCENREPEGNEQVQISTRVRGAPLDLIVAEAMILANSTWGQWLGEFGVPGIYRSQASMAPGVKVRMGTKMLPHAGIGVPAYAWSTSPLRRYTDLVNQWQIICCARHGKTAALVAPFKPKDTDLFAIISSFDAAYSAYNSYQAGMERFWTLKYLQQQGISELLATVIKDGYNGGVTIARADDLPLVLPVLGGGDLPRGAKLRLKLGAIDEISLELTGQFLERLDSEVVANDDEEDETITVSLAIAVDVNEADTHPEESEVARSNPAVPANA